MDKITKIRIPIICIILLFSFCTMSGCASFISTHLAPPKNGADSYGNPINKGNPGGAPWP